MRGFRRARARGGRRGRRETAGAAGPRVRVAWAVRGAPEGRWGGVHVVRSLLSPSRGGGSAVCSTERDPFLGTGVPSLSRRNRLRFFGPSASREAATSVNPLQQNNVVVVNISGIPNLEDQQRAVDFIAGACYALEGQQAVLAESILHSSRTTGATRSRRSPR